MIEIETSDPDVMDKLRALAESDPTQIYDITSKKMSGSEVMTILIENIDKIGFASVAILAALRFDILKIKISKDGAELSGEKKREMLSPGGDA